MELYSIHRAIIQFIRLLPTQLGVLILRAYNKTLKELRPEYTCKTYFGSHLYCNLNDRVQSFIFNFGVWEPDISRVIEQNLAPGDVFVDIGANVGYDTLLGSRLVGPKGKVVAIEASPTTFSLLQRNLAINETSSNVRAVNVAVSDGPGKLDLFQISKYNIGAATSITSRGGTFLASVDALPLRQILVPDEIKRLRLIKMDVEGAELGILLNLLEELFLFPENMDLIVEASASDDIVSWNRVFDQLKAAGFSAYEIRNEYELESYLTWRQPSQLRQTQTLPTRQQDLLFTRRPKTS